jgi:CheY-like chemotaxis protein
MENEEISGLPGAHVLLVEDSLFVQHYVRTLLEEVGVTVDIVHNGMEAVQKLLPCFHRGCGQYDAVLMDLEMPIMGGCEASRLIRSQDGMCNIPIIALTAHTDENYRNRCFDAGMNDYLIKPMDRDSLYKSLSRWIQGAVRDASEISHISHQENEIFHLPDRLEGLEVMKAVKRLGGNGKLYLRLVELFADQMATLPEQIADSLRDRNFSLAGRLAHTLKGAAASLGAVALQEEAEKLEHAIAAGQCDANLVAPVHACLTVVLSAAQAINEGNTLPNGATGTRAASPDGARVRELLKQLDELLRCSCFGALDVFEQLRTLTAPTEISSSLGQLEKYMRVLDFDKALRELDTVRTVIITGVKGG